MMVLAIHQRLAELWTIQQKQRALTKEELDEMGICLEANSNHVWKMQKLENLSMLANMTNDPDWQYELYYRIEELNSGKQNK